MNKDNLIIHSKMDNVGVLICGVDERLIGSKIALSDISAGDAIVKMAVTIGIAITDIPAGNRVDHLNIQSQYTA